MRCFFSNESGIKEKRTTDDREIALVVYFTVERDCQHYPVVTITVTFFMINIDVIYALYFVHFFHQMIIIKIEKTNLTFSFQTEQLSSFEI